MPNQHARSLRKTLTDAERVLWFNLRDRRLGGWKFRRQHVIGPFIVDFVCVEKQLIIEVDGRQHAEMTTTHFKTGFFCHPERSEGSQSTEKMRFFAALRMTIWE